MTIHIRDRVADLVGREPLCVPADETLRTAAHQLWAAAVGVLIVGDARSPLGVISERDIIARLAQGADPDVATVRDAMTTYLISARPEDPVFDVASQMMDDEIRHFPVVDDHGAVLGMVSIRDLLRPLLVDALGSSPGAEPSSS